MLNYAGVSSESHLLASSLSLDLPRETQAGHRGLLAARPDAPLT